MAYLLPMMYLYVVVVGQLSQGPNSNRSECEIGDNYCGGSSLETQTLITCGKNQAVQVLSCKDQLSRILPAGYEGFALCYKASTDSDDAVCAFNGTGYELDFSSFPIPSSYISVLKSNIFIRTAGHTEAYRDNDMNRNVPLSIVPGSPTPAVVPRAESITGSAALVSPMSQQEPGPPSTEPSATPSHAITTSVISSPETASIGTSRTAQNSKNSPTHPTITETTPSSTVPGSVTIHTITFTPLRSAASWTRLAPTLSAVMAWVILVYAAQNLH